MYSRVFHGTSFTAMATGVLFLVPVRISLVYISQSPVDARDDRTSTDDVLSYSLVSPLQEDWPCPHLLREETLTLAGTSLPLRPAILDLRLTPSSSSLTIGFRMVQVSIGITVGGSYRHFHRLISH